MVLDFLAEKYHATKAAEITLTRSEWYEVK